MMFFLILSNCLANSKFKNPTDGFNGYFIHVLFLENVGTLRSGTTTTSGEGSSNLAVSNLISLSNVPLNLTKNGFDGSIGIKLNSSILTDVTVQIAVDVSNVFIITPISFNFTSNNYNTEQFFSIVVDQITLGSIQDVNLTFSGTNITSKSIMIKARDSIYPFPLLKTGITSCYNSNNTITCNDPGFPKQDADYQSIIGASLTYSGPILLNISDYITKDLSSGLTWVTCSDGLTGSGCLGTASFLNYSQSITQCTNLNSGNGFANIKKWRLPNISELRSLMNLSNTDFINTLSFPSNKKFAYWSISNDISNATNNAMVFDFSVGEISSVLKSSTHYIRCVSGP